MSNYDPLSSNALVPRRQNLDLSDEEYSTEVSGSNVVLAMKVKKNDDDSDCVDDYKNIFDFQLNSNSSVIKINILESAEDYLIETFNQIWTDDAVGIIISSINNYGKNPASSLIKKLLEVRFSKIPTKKKSINYLLFGSGEFSVSRDAFSNNRLHYYPIVASEKNISSIYQLIVISVFDQ